MLETPLSMLEYLSLTLSLAHDSSLLPVQTLGGNGDGLSNWVPATHVGDPGGVPASQL